MDDEHVSNPAAADSDSSGRDAEIFRRREAGVSWLEIQREFNLTRQQARYSYQQAKRVERRKQRRSG